MFGLLPRVSVDLELYNECLKSLCQTHNVEFVDHYNGFLLASGDIADSYYYTDKLHTNAFGTRKLLRNLDTVHCITSPYPRSQPAGPVSQKRPFAGRADSYSRRYHNCQHRKASHNVQSQNGLKYCHICLVRGHGTQECWFNGRDRGMNRYHAQ